MLTGANRNESRGDAGRPGVSRRRFLECSLLAGGAGLTLSDILRLQAQAAEAGHKKADTAVIQLWLGGGHSQFETFDPKPDAPAEIRGPYRPIQTKFPGILFCEKLPRTAQVIDKIALIRSVAHATNDHFSGYHWCHTGYRGISENLLHPSSGSIVSAFRGPNRPGLPAYVLLSEEQTRNLGIGKITGPGYLNVRNAPFTILQDPFQSAFQPEKLGEATHQFRLADDLTLDQIRDRKTLLAGLDQFRRQADTRQAVEGFDDFQRQAMDMVLSGKAIQAFDLTREPESVRAKYGKHRWGQMGLLARRLVEAGTTFVTINTAPDSLCWDWHLNIVNDQRPADGSNGPSRGMDISGPPLDQMLTALITDLYERGLDKKVLLVVWGEFGRTPIINKTGGRDHWGALMSILLAGGGLKVGQVIGASTKNGDRPSDRPVAPTDVLATIYRHLGIDPSQRTYDQSGRPFNVLPEGEVIRELM